MQIHHFFERRKTMLIIHVIPMFDHIVPAMHNHMDRFFNVNHFHSLKYEAEQEMYQ